MSAARAHVSGISCAPDARGPLLAVREVACGYEGAAVLQDVSFQLEAGTSTVLLGPNGVGKTTLFKTILGFLPRLGGEILVDGRSVDEWGRRELACLVAYVPQAHDTAFGFTVHDLILMGRTPHLAGAAAPSRDDERAASAMIEQMGLGHLAQRPCTSLSGGELQMALIARALVQRPRILMMDEPCANLDVGNQAIVLSKVRELADAGLCVLVTSHDPNHALVLGDRAIGVFRGGEVQSGPVAEMLTCSVLERLYGVPVGMGRVHGTDGRSTPVCAPLIGSPAPVRAGGEIEANRGGNL